MATIEDHFEVSQLDTTKDYEKLEVGDGYVQSTNSSPTIGIHPKADVHFIALLEFLHDEPRGNHYHKRKVEHMVLLRGKLRCNFSLPENPSKTVEVVLIPGQMVRILPGCVHTYTALEGDAFALEYAAQRYEAADVIVVA